jgi:hypothetical protein
MATAADTGSDTVIRTPVIETPGYLLIRSAQKCGQG